MKLYHLVAVFGMIGLMAAIAPAHAADPGAAPVAGSNWTEDNVKTLCTHRFPGNPKRFDMCIKNNSKKIGTKITPAQVQEIQTGAKPNKGKGKKGNGKLGQTPQPAQPVQSAQ